MEVQCSPFSWEFCYQEEGIEDMKHSLLYATLELETTILSAKEKIGRREEEVAHLKDLLSRALQERDEAQAKCQRLVLDKLMLQQELQNQQKQQQQVALLAPNNEDESKGSDSNKHFSSSESGETIIASPNAADPTIMPPPLSPPLPQAALKLGAEKPLILPEKGKLLQAVIEAGPLLQTLLLAGPLPQWQHPPPQLKSIEIPPVSISPPTPRLLHQDSCISSTSTSCFSNKRSLVCCDASGSDSSPASTKYQKVVRH